MTDRTADEVRGSPCAADSGRPASSRVAQRVATLRHALTRTPADALLRGRFAILLALALVTLFWLPALWSGRVPVHGDSTILGLPLLRQLASALHGGDGLLWNPHISGGHPLFAEGQGGFANPLSLLVAYFVEPARGLGVLHWSSVIVGIAGVFCLCRCLEISHWASTFACIAVAFSGTWVSQQHNLPMSTTIAWGPWLIASVEWWLKAPSIRRASAIAVAFACMVFGGYPQITHSALIYIAMLLIARVLQRDTRQFLLAHWRNLLISGAIASVLGIALAAIQLVPLFELVGESHRREGIALSLKQVLSYERAFRGLLYFYFGSDPAGVNRASLGNIPVVFLASAALLIATPARIVGHALAGFLLFNLGMSRVSPLFRALYDWHLLPGLHNYRIVHPFYLAAVIGLAVVAAYALDCVARERVTWWALFEKRPKLRAACASGLAIGLLVTCYTCYAAPISLAAFAAPAAIAAGYLALRARDRQQWLPLVAALALAGDVAALRMQVFAFFDPKVLEQPAMVRALTEDPNLRDYRVMNTTSVDGITFKHVSDPTLGELNQRAMQGLSAFPIIEWRIRSMGGIMALPLARWKLLWPVVEEEAKADRGAPSGARIMDIQGVRYVSTSRQLTHRGLSLFAIDDHSRLSIYRNRMARPRFQVYWNATSAVSAEDALAQLRAARDRTLVLENAFSGERPQLGAANSRTDEEALAAPIRVTKASAMRYRAWVDVPSDAWLFLADANYPGWSARVNDVETPVFTAQVLGKAVRLRAGSNRVVFEFIPRTFYWGAAISALALACVLGIALWPWLRQRARRRQYGLSNRPSAA